MECRRFQKLLKSWYIQVQEEALAPARMVNFMETHLEECQICMMDPEAHKDVKKIITLVLPQDKLKVVSRSSRKTEAGDLGEEDEEVMDEATDEVADDDESGDEDSEDDDEIDEVDEFDDEEED